MKLNDFIAGLQILQGYFDTPDKYCIGAEHDIFYVYSTDKPLSPEDVAKLVQLGWHQEEAVTDGEFTAENYDPEESWSAYT
jgi:hypothetical protein